MKITHITPLIYTPGDMEYFQFIRGGVGADYHQGPVFYRALNNDIIMYWNAYDFNECSGNCVKLYSVSRDRGLTWSDPQVFMVDYPGGVPFNLLMLPLQENGNVMMIHTRVRHKIEVDERRRTCTGGGNYFQSMTRLFIRRSTDGGRTFDHGEELPYLLVTGGKELPGVGFYGVLDGLIQLQSGRIVAVFYFLDPIRCDPEKGIQHYTAACLLSDDGGLTWKRSGEITVDTPRGVMEPQMVETEPNRLFCLFRTKGGFVYQTVSTDGGETWSTSVPSPLPAPESMTRMIKLQSGSLLAV
ncbi:MAG: sialidase family protein, partial [bacterium]|nr:sialidase family protein [bacterium]